MYVHVHEYNDINGFLDTNVTCAHKERRVLLEAPNQYIDLFIAQYVYLYAYIYVCTCT